MGAKFGKIKIKIENKNKLAKCQMPNIRRRLKFQIWINIEKAVKIDRNDLVKLVRNVCLLVQKY